MVEANEIITRIRVNGGNIVLDSGRLKIINGARLPAGARDFIKAHGKEIAAFLDNEGEFNERAAIIEHDGGLTRKSAEYLTHLLLSSVPIDVSPADWTWFVSKATEIIDRRTA